MPKTQYSRLSRVTWLISRFKQCVRNALNQAVYWKYEADGWFLLVTHYILNYLLSCIYFMLGFRCNGAHFEWIRGSLSVTCAQNEQVWNGGLWACKTVLFPILNSKLTTFLSLSLILIFTPRTNLLIFHLPPVLASKITFWPFSSLDYMRCVWVRHSNVQCYSWFSVTCKIMDQVFI